MGNILFCFFLQQIGSAERCQASSEGEAPIVPQPQIQDHWGTAASAPTLSLRAEASTAAAAAECSTTHEQQRPRADVRECVPEARHHEMTRHQRPVVVANTMNLVRKFNVASTLGRWWRSTPLWLMCRRVHELPVNCVW